MNEIENLLLNKSAENCQTMFDVRNDVDQLDKIIVELLAKRQSYMDAAARIKANRNLVRDEARIEDVVNKVKATAELHGLNNSIIEPVYRLLIEKCIEYEFLSFDRQFDKK